MPPSRRTTTAPDPVPAGEPSPTPAEEVEPTPPAPDPEPTGDAWDRLAAGDLLGTLRERTDSLAYPTPEALAEAVQGFTAGVTRTQRTLLGEVERDLTVYEAIAEVTRRIGAVPKTGTATQGGTYKYRGIDHVLGALHPILGEVGLVLLPGRVVRESWETRATSSGGTLNVARLLVRFRLVGPDGSRLVGEAWGEGGDSGDKATQKAHSQAYKSFVFETFSIPTEESERDEPDATNPPSRPFGPEELLGASQAWTAARDADTVEKLAGVRARALRRLDVPVQDDDGSLVPLSILFDRRRTELERGTSS